MKRKLVFCKTKVNASNIRHETRDGVDHIIITSYTLPPDIVMNRGLYPAEEVNKSFKTLERTLAPIEHPENDGQFISASDPFAINNFYGGAWNENVEQVEDGRIKIDKVINVQKALDSEKGKRLLDRVNGMEDGSDSRSIHTSVGVYLETDVLDAPMTNDAGEEYDWVARGMFFDHDAILLDSVGAATPNKGVGIGVNKEAVDVEFVVCELDEQPPVIKALDMRTNQDMSFNEIHSALYERINEGITEYDKKSYIMEVYDEYFIYETPSGEMFQSNYMIDDKGNLEIQDTRLPVERVVEYRPINQPTNEDDAMRDKIIAELKKMGISVNADISDSDLKVEYDQAKAAELAANASDDDDKDAPSVNADLEKTVQDQQTEIDTLKANAQTRLDADLDKQVKVIQANKKYADLSDTALKAIHANSAEDFDKMFNSSKTSYGIGSEPFETQSDGMTINTKVEDLPE